MNFFLGVSTNQGEPWNTNQQNAARLYMYVANYIISVLTRNFFDDPEDAQIGGDNEDAVYQGPLNDGKTTRNHLIRQRFV